VCPNGPHRSPDTGSAASGGASLRLTAPLGTTCRREGEHVHARHQVQTRCTHAAYVGAAETASQITRRCQRAQDLACAPAGPTGQAPARHIGRQGVRLLAVHRRRAETRRPGAKRNFPDETAIISEPPMSQINQECILMVEAPLAQQLQLSRARSGAAACCGPFRQHAVSE
jgi:hypothetical protein